MKTVYDPLRRKEVTATPEEIVRQWFISRLAADFKVPAHMMMSEVGLKLGRKSYRADIVIYARDGRPLAVVECKQPSVALDADVLMQALRYHSALDVRWIMVSNGSVNHIYRRGADGIFSAYASVPTYEEMLCCA